MKTNTNTLIARLKKVAIKNGAGQRAYAFHFVAVGEIPQIVHKWDYNKKDWIDLGEVSRDLILGLCLEEGLLREGEVMPKRMEVIPDQEDEDTKS